MTYERVLELKNAGFPLRKLPTGWEDEQHEVYDIEGFYYFVPNFSEFVEAFGENFFALYRMRDRDESQRWGALVVGTGWSYGPTPIEAIAQVWLELHKE